MKIRTLFLSTFAMLTLGSTAQDVTDSDGNVYTTVSIGSQQWMVQNLRTTKYNDGTPIPLSVESFNSETPVYCWYDNDSTTNAVPYGALYNWHVVNTGILCPTGWHVPTDDEFTTLCTYLGGENVAGGKLKEAGTTHWLEPNTGGDNSSGFTALPGGQRDRSNGVLFNAIGSLGFYWGATEHATNPGYAWIRGIANSSPMLSRLATNAKTGNSVRCINNNSSSIQEQHSIDFQIYPNPVTNKLNIDFPNEGNANVQLINMLGQCALSLNVSSSQNAVDVSSLPSGIYVVEIVGENWSMQKKFVKK